MDNNNDVEELYAELEKELANDESEEQESSGASDQKPESEVISDKSPDDENAEMSEEEISKLSPRAQKRIRELADENKRLKEKPEETKVGTKEESKDNPQEFNSTQEFLDALTDPDTKELFKKFNAAQQKELESKLSPIEDQKNSIEFEKQFNDFKDIEGIETFKEDFKMTYQRDPSKSVRSLVADKVLELQTKKVATTVSRPSTPSHEGMTIPDDASLEDLYEALETMKP